MSQEEYLEGGSLWRCDDHSAPPVMWDKKGAALGVIKPNSITLVLADAKIDSNSYASVLVDGKLCYIDVYWWRLKAFSKLT